MAVAFIFKLKCLDKKIFRDQLLLLSFGFLFFLSILTLFAFSEFQEHQPLILDGMLKSLQLGYFVLFLVAFWMNRYQNLWSWCVIALFAGHMVRIFRTFDWEAFQSGFRLIWAGAERLRLGSTVNRFGLWNAVILLGCIVLCRHLWGTRASNHRIVFWTRVMFWALVTLIASAGLVFAQSRSAWLAAILVIPAVCLYQWVGQRQIKLKSIGISAGILLLVSVITNLPTVFKTRLFLSENAFYNASIRNAADTRLLLYRLAWEKWGERPWVGFGPGTSEIIIKQAGDEYAAIIIWDHFHNIALDIMVQLGVVGIIFYGFLLYLIIRQLIIAKKMGFIETPYYLFTLGSLAIIMIAGLFGQPFGDYKGIFLFGFLGGMCYHSKSTGERCRRIIKSDRF
jgi:O-antigen ligase